MKNYKLWLRSAYMESNRHKPKIRPNRKYKYPILVRLYKRLKSL